jgi:hypothetical protein
MRIGLNAALTFNLALVLVVLAMLAVALTRDFGGGHLVALVAAFSAGSLVWVMVADGLFPSIRRKNSPAQRTAFDEADAKAPPARESWLAVFYAVLLFILVYVLGTLLGCVLFVGAYLLLHRRGHPWRAVFLAFIVGAAVPYLLGGALDVRLWEGVMPEIIPGWIGGGTAPPL